MRRSALATARPAQSRLKATWTPVVTVILGSLLALLPIILSQQLLPSFGLMMLVAWRGLRPDLWSATSGVPLGFAHDLITGNPIGQSIVLWTFILLILDFIDQRMLWRDYWIEWGLAGLLFFGAAAFDWWIARLAGSGGPFAAILPHVGLSLLLFPAVLGLVVRLDRWRLRA